MSSEQNYYVECPVQDSYYCFKTLEFLAATINKVVPLSFTCKGMTINMQQYRPKDKAKKLDGYHLRAFLQYKSSNLPDYSFMRDGKENATRCTNPSKKITFGISSEALLDAFGKTNIKPSTNIKLYSKPKQTNMFYNKDDGQMQYTLKAAVGYVDEELAEPQIFLGEESFSINEETNKEPNFSITVETFIELCTGLKKRSGSDLNITVFPKGAKFQAVEYGSSGKEVFCTYGYCTTPIDSYVLDTNFLVKFCGVIDKISHLKSIVKFYFGKSEKSNNFIITLIIKVGLSGTLLYQKEIIPA